MTTIRLEGLDFFAHHGYYEEERKMGNRYTIDVEVVVEGVAYTDDSITATINYEEIHLTVAAIMSVPTKLLETIASRINEELMGQFPSAMEVNTTVSKHNPPIKGVCKKASVSIRHHRAQ